MSTTPDKEHWRILVRFLPKGWEQKAYDLGALARRRKIDSAETLLRLLLIHLADGKSLRTTAAYAKEVGLCDINDVALLHRLQVSERWLCCIAMELQKGLQGTPLPDHLVKKYRIRFVDGTSISETGSAGTDWRIHYCFKLVNFICDSFIITTPEIGESFERYFVEQGDLMVGDRGYCKRERTCSPTTQTTPLPFASIISQITPQTTHCSP